MPTLSDPLQLPCGLELPNRLAKAAMTEGLADKNDDPGPELFRLYERWSRGGAGLLVTGNAIVDRTYLERARNVVIDDDSDGEKLAAWAQSCKVGGSKAIVQLSHAGRQTNMFVATTPVAPSAVQAVKMLYAFGKPRALTIPEIEGIIAAFATAAARCQEAGFDGVQVHGAHGYLVSQFLSPLTNLREDAWGGSLEGRARFLLEIIKAVRERVSASFAVTLKLNSADFQRGGFTFEESLQVIGMLNGTGLDLIEVSGGNYESPELLGIEDQRRESTRQREAYFLDFAKEAQSRTPIPLMLTGGMRTRGIMEDALASGAVDVIGLARPLAFDPEFARKLLDGEAAESPVSPKRTGVRMLEAAAESGWYWRQIWRLAHDRQPDPGLDPRVSAFGLIAYDAGNAIRRRLRRRFR